MFLPILIIFSGKLENQSKILCAVSLAAVETLFRPLAPKKKYSLSFA